MLLIDSSASIDYKKHIDLTCLGEIYALRRLEVIAEPHEINVDMSFGPNVLDVSLYGIAPEDLSRFECVEGIRSLDVKARAVDAGASRRHCNVSGFTSLKELSLAVGSGIVIELPRSINVVDFSGSHEIYLPEGNVMNLQELKEIKVRKLDDLIHALTFFMAWNLETILTLEEPEPDLQVLREMSRYANPDHDVLCTLDIFEKHLPKKPWHELVLDQRRRCLKANRKVDPDAKTEWTAF
ncbi:hypothetical protein [Paraburkholderia sp. EG286A]